MGCLVVARHEKAVSAITETRREFIGHEVATCDPRGVFVLRKGGSFLFGSAEVHLTVSKPGHGTYSARMTHPHETGPGRFVGGRFQLDPVASFIEAKAALGKVRGASTAIEKECDEGKQGAASCRAVADHLQQWQAFVDKTYPYMTDPKLAATPRTTRHGVARVSSWPLLRGSEAAILAVALRPEGGLVVLERGGDERLGLVWLGRDGSVAAEAALPGFSSAGMASQPSGELVVSDGKVLRRFSADGQPLSSIELRPSLPEGAAMVDMVARGDGWLLGVRGNWNRPELVEFGPDGKLRGKRVLEELRELLSLAVPHGEALFIHGEQRVSFDYASELAGMKKDDGAPRNLLRLADLDEATAPEVLISGVDAVSVDATGIWAYSRDRYRQAERAAVADRKRGLRQLLIRANLTGQIEGVYDISDPELGPARMRMASDPARVILHPPDPISETGVDLLELRPSALQALPRSAAPLAPK